MYLKLMGNPCNCRRKRKYKFRNNQHTAKKSLISENIASFPIKKPIEVKIATQVSSTNENGYSILIDFQLLKRFIEQTAICSEGDSRDVTLRNKLSSRLGLASKLILLCNNCQTNVSFFTSKECSLSTGTQGRNLFEPNVRAVIAFREIGKGHEAISNFSQCMNMLYLNQLIVISMKSFMQLIMQLPIGAWKKLHS